MLLTASGFLIAGFVGLGLWWIYGRVLLMGERRKKGGKNGPGGWAQRMPLWKTATATAYELTDRHEV